MCGLTGGADWPISGDMDACIEKPEAGGRIADCQSAIADSPNGTAAGAFPPPGWVTNRETARRLGVSLETLTCNAWKWRRELRAAGRCVRMPGGGRCNIYAVDAVQRIIDEREASAQREIPEGFVDKDGACQMFGVTRHVWKTWIRQGKIGFGQIIFTPSGHKYRVYAIADLKCLKDELFGEDKLYKSGDNTWHVPAGYMRREEAWEKFGVGIRVWERWEREGKITCGQRVGQAPKLYKVEDIHRMLDEYGRWCPPYPDPDRAGVYRVPLSGRDIKRREALIDAHDLPLIEGGSCAWARSDGKVGFVSLSHPNVPHGTPLRRVIMGITDAGLNVRHVNRDPLDCRRQNLIVRTPKQRTRNARKMRTYNGQPCTSRFKGVFWETQTKRWRAVIRVDGKNRSLGRFGDEIAAAQAYDEAAMKWFGEHAWLNFPDGVDAWLACWAQQSEPPQREAA